MLRAILKIMMTKKFFLNGSDNTKNTNFTYQLLRIIKHSYKFSKLFTISIVSDTKHY